ncbi:hypothetical protein [Saccharopolyspora taberi]|uniref:Excreted virulence factor EspC (Type VII ESX diderm) n=1 Tax=Saccharopolyspora taberi TaxID=60895 RepID=A0ABN3V785_9PSEU
MSGFEVDPGVLDGISSRLQNASADVDALGKAVPGPPDAGDGGPAVTGILAHLVENASALVLGLAGAGDDITETNKTYQAQDAAAGYELHKTSGGK